MTIEATFFYNRGQEVELHEAKSVCEMLFFLAQWREVIENES